jgi:1-acyl-sn-glycerol-3-phosphate acyltransferase
LISQDATADALLAVVHQLATELHPAKAGSPPTLDSQLERDLGFDSLARVELMLRMDRAFGVSLPEQTLVAVETPRDLLRAVLAARAAAPIAPAPEVPPAIPLASVEIPERAATLNEVLEWHVRSHPERVHIVLLTDGGGEEEITYAALRAGARRVAAALAARDLQPGTAVAIMLPTSRDYFFSFFGVLMSGCIPVPIYPPARASQVEEHMQRHAGILSNAQVAALITVPEAKALALLLRSQVPTLASVLTLEDLHEEGAGEPVHNSRPEDIAFLQYTSGSTGNPKGVVLTHANLLANLRAMGKATQATSTDVFVSWLPLYHDMGLIGAWMGSLYFAFKLVVMSPLAFLARPPNWLWAIHRHRGTLSAAPNFAYQLCARRIAESDLEGLDLSSWRLAFNGAEPVSPETIEEFATRFARYGLRREAITPVYGLAESSVGLAFPQVGRGPKVDRIRRDVLTNSARAQPAAPGDTDVLEIVACGHPLPGHQVRIVDGQGHELAERQEGHLQFKGPSATSGYYRNPEETRKLFAGEWLDSGDFAYIAEGEVYLTGRSKDIIIRAGRNIYPYQLEDAVGNIPGIRKGCVAVFGSLDPRTHTERVVVLAESREKDPRIRAELTRKIGDCALELIGMPADDIVLAPPHTVLKTSSGKIRRAACRELYDRGGRGVIERALWWQLARVAFASIVPQLRRALARLADWFYAGYVWLWFGVLAPSTWLVALCLSHTQWSWSLSRAAARALFRLTGVPLVTRGAENLPPPGEPCVLAINHASYLDGIVVVAALARQYSFVAKRELQDHFVSRAYLRSIGSEFIERFDLQRGLEDTERLLGLLRGGRSLAFFPEGTFRRMPGLLPFRMGAFVVAAQANVPVVPVTIRGTRSVLRENQWLPRRAMITVTIGAPIRPASTDWSGAIGLRDAVRAAMLRTCGEPDLATEQWPPPK